jgi:multidrug efflux pump subunit AcrA (membrane-fusion protein)
LSVSFAAIVIAVMLAGCGKSSSPDSDSDEQPPAVVMSVTAAKVRVAPMREEFHMLGETVALRHISVRAPAAGQVIGLNLQNGDRVRQGQVVAHLRNREVEAAEQGLEVARHIDPAEAAAMEQAVRQYTRDPGIMVRAPENAVVAQRMVSSGQMVNDLDPMLDLIDPNSIYVEAAVPIDDMSLIRPGMNAIVTTALQPGTEFPARVAALSPIFTQGAAATSSARLEFTGPGKIHDAGAPVEIQVIVKTAPDAIVIPSSALFQDAVNDSFYVFVAGPDAKAHRTRVAIGIRTAAAVQVTSGLVPGQLVITSGGYALSDGLKVNTAVAQN